MISLSPLLDNLSLEDLRPLLCAMVDGEDYDPVMVNGVGCDKGRIRNHQLTSTRNPARPA